MNVSNAIFRLYELASTATSSFELMVLAKAIEKLRVGAIRTVSTFGDLPTLPLSENGELYLVEADEDLYYNVGSEWILINSTFIDISAWGSNSNDQLGDGSYTYSNKTSPVRVIGGITNWSQMSAGGFHSLGVTDDGIAYAWGSNSSGKLGDGETVDINSPVTVIGGITNWSQVNAGSAHSLGITADGIAYAWGANSFGRLGDGTTTNRSSPVTVAGGITWSQVSAGNNHSLGLRTNGIAYAWGSNSSGRLGDGTTANKSSPVRVIGGITNWSQVSAGGSHSLAVRTNGVAYAWGANSSGQLGDGSSTTTSAPVTVVGGITNWSQVSAGSSHSLGLTTNGVAYAWGNNNNGRLGDGTTISRSSPVTVIGGITNWSSLSAGGSHSLGVTATGIAYAWGSNGNGRLGDGTTIDRSSPVTIIGGITNWSSLSTGGSHSLGLKSR